MLRRLTLLLFFLSFINAQIALPTFQGVHKPQGAASCDQTVTINQSDRGWYTSNGNHGANNENTITGPGYTPMLILGLLLTLAGSLGVLAQLH